MWEYSHTDELYHYGVKGMKWGVRKSEQKSNELDRKKDAYRNAKKSYNRSFRKASNRAIAAYSPIERHRQANDRRWNNVTKKASELAKAKDDYKSAKKEFSKNATLGQRIKHGTKTTRQTLNVLGRLVLADVIITGGTGTKVAVKSAAKGAKYVAKGAKYVKDAALNRMFNTAVLDAAGKVIYRYNS